MANNKLKTLFSMSFIVSLLIILLIPSSLGSLHSEISFSIGGTISSYPTVNINVDPNKKTSKNNLSLGFQLDFERWKLFVDRPAQRQLAQNVGFKLIRVFDFRKTTPRLMPCTYWDEATQTGTWDWTQVDALTQAIFSVGAEPLFCLGWAYYAGEVHRFIPDGMAINPNTQLPYSESYAAYAIEWVKHFRELDWPVRYYEILNEPFAYFGWNPQDTTKLSYYVDLWNTVARSMRQENPNILLSQDAITMKTVFDYWLQHGDNVDFLDFHKYDSVSIEEYTDAQLFDLAERNRFETTTSFYGVDHVQQEWFNSRGAWLPLINSESNLNVAADDGTDPRIQQMSGAVWTALVLRGGIMKGLSYNVYFEFSSSKSWELNNRQSGGLGFGMTNTDDNQPWYPYYVHQMIGTNLHVGDPIVEATSSSSEVRVLAWINQENLIILVICKTDESRVLNINGVEETLNFFKIDNTISYETPSIQEGTIEPPNTLIMEGYTVLLLRAPLH